MVRHVGSTPGPRRVDENPDEDPDDPLRWPRRRRQDPVCVLAHRGGTGPWHENSVEAFSGALRLGADGVELDVRRSADGELVVHHDPLVPGSGLIHERRHEELPGWIPTLERALASCAGAIVNVEIKNVPTDPAYDPTNQVALDVAVLLATHVGTARPGPARVIVSSFWPDTLAAVRGADLDADRGGDEDPSAPLGLLVHPALDASSALDTATSLGCVALHPHHSQVTADLVGRAHDSGLAVVTWTVNLPEDLDAVVEAGVDVVITDDVANTLAHLGRA